MVKEPESALLRQFLRRKQPLVASALALTEVARALLPFGAEVTTRGEETFRRIELIRINDRILHRAGRLLPVELRSLDAIHVATAMDLGDDLARLCTYDERMGIAAQTLGLRVASPGAG